MKSPNSIPDRPRDTIDEVEDLCAQGGQFAEVSPKYYASFLALSDAEMEVMARAVLNSEAKGARQVIAKEPNAEPPARLIRFVGNALYVIAIGLGRFNQFAQLRLFKRVGPETEPDVDHALREKIANARPIIERGVRDFIQKQHEAGPELGSSPTKQTPVPPAGDGWQTLPNPELDSARIWQLQLTLFPRTPREACERMGLNWLAARHLYADGWLSFDPGKVVTLNEAHEAELRLVGPLVAAGCDAELLARLFNGLRRPYQYRPGSIYLDWAAARWRLLPVAAEPDPPQIFAGWLDTLKESGDRQQLEDIARDVATALKSLPQEEPIQE